MSKAISAIVTLGNTSWASLRTSHAVTAGVWRLAQCLRDDIGIEEDQNSGAGSISRFSRMTASKSRGAPAIAAPAARLHAHPPGIKARVKRSGEPAKLA